MLILVSEINTFLYKHAICYLKAVLQYECFKEVDSPGTGEKRRYKWAREPF